MWLCLIWGVNPKVKSLLGGCQAPAPCSPARCQPCPGGAAPLQPRSSSRNASGLCCRRGVLGDACSAPAICALGYPLNHGDLHGNPMRPGISLPLCIKQHQLPCNLIVCVLNINQQTVGWSRANSSPGTAGCSCRLPLRPDGAHPGVLAPRGCAAEEI